ncbi:hypothetical protein K504DRAFT_380635 [Pleomassaria siparia CBS 279.74]|uniref:BTB domain-containing protein n=1 Tax=Pleomassaria siparia CBS 279.74 TaxID=1314801 RepID=A0A6G1K9H7_9PLEO|nr:hypothetical protein K504DRAFT_380635 [Pleomassaria siparia CBS 279.74]
MTHENYIRDLSEYLTPGNLTDLELNFGTKSWKIHKALACSHSKWFRKAATIGFEETDSGVITLKDDPGFANAIDCMVSYFYEAGYNASKYDTSEAFLHAQVTIIADKYDCTSLYNLARTLFAEAIKTVKSNDWAAVAALAYDQTTTEIPAHVQLELHDLVVTAVARRHSVLRSILRTESAVQLLHSSADLATDLLLHGPHGPKAQDPSEHIFVCEHCRYVHVGPRDCLNEGSTKTPWKTCPQCKCGPGTTSKRITQRVGILPTFSCPSCYGIHTALPVEPVPEPEP